MALPYQLLALVIALVVVGTLAAPALAATDTGSTVAATATPTPDDGMMGGENMTDESMDDGSMDDGNLTDESMDDGSMDDRNMTGESMDDGSMDDESMGEEMMTEESMNDGSMDDSMTDAGDDASGRSSTPGQPGFGLLVAVVALAGAALLALRRRG